MHPKKKKKEINKTKEAEKPQQKIKRGRKATVGIQTHTQVSVLNLKQVLVSKT